MRRDWWSTATRPERIWGVPVNAIRSGSAAMIFAACGDSRRWRVPRQSRAVTRGGTGSGLARTGCKSTAGRRASRCWKRRRSGRKDTLDARLGLPQPAPTLEEQRAHLISLLSTTQLKLALSAAGLTGVDRRSPRAMREALAHGVAVTAQDLARMLGESGQTEARRVRPAPSGPPRRRRAPQNAARRTRGRRLISLGHSWQSISRQQTPGGTARARLRWCEWRAIRLWSDAPG